MEYKELVIDRSQWLRGEPNSRLYRAEDSKRCCLGTYCLSLGFKEEQLSGVSLPATIKLSEEDKLLKRLPDWLIEQIPFIPSDNEYYKSDVRQLFLINDDSLISDEEREKQISTIFANHNVRVKFIN